MNLYIFTRDLRIIDNLALHKSLKDNKTIPIFVFTPEQIKNNPYRSDNAINFMIQSLKELAVDIKKKKGKLHFFFDTHINVLKSIIKEEKINKIIINKDYSPYAKKREQEIDKFCHQNNIIFESVEDINLLPMGKLLNKSNEAYKVFTPFFRNSKKYWKEIIKPKKLNKYPFLKKTFDKEIKLSEINFQKNTILMKGGRKEGLKLLKETNKQKDYSSMRNNLTYQTTLLSAHIKFGTISIREVFYQFKKDLKDDNTLFSQLIWREFYLYIMNYYPDVLNKQVSTKENQDFQNKFSKMKWKNNEKEFEAWKNGKTGFPIVDACMTELNNTGYMHNRGRLLVSSFLIKLCLIDWRWGEKYFAQKLTDYDPASNNGGWQFHHGGASNADYFRILSPISQGERFDKKAEYIKKWLPNLKDIPAKHLIDWEKHHLEYDLKKINYYKPIFDYKERRKEALEIYKKSLSKKN